ncbi:MAG TPA: acetoin utilization protein AcuC [Thermoanaerobaculia bacterium]|nr:acetoin utilization protein AcuC [Thermoanaerobaculia bacterium]
MAAVIYHPAYGRYAFGDRHPFQPVRVEMTLDLLDRLGHPVLPVEPSPATRAEVLEIHEDYYVRRVEELSRGEAVADAVRYGLGTDDTPAFPGMDEAARWHVGGTLEAARAIVERGERRVVQLGGGLHHAQRNFAAGFCVYNDLAIAIAWLVRKGLWVAYVDIDVHHGDGVQQILYDDGRVLTASLHESGRFLFPGSGEIRDLGSGLGRGLKLNVPLEPFTDGESWLAAFDAVVPEAIRRFRPGIIVVQAGADAHFADPLADLMLTTRDYEAIFRRLLALADELTAGRILFTLGGGYAFGAAARIWSTLCLLAEGRSVPATLPAGWAERWENVAGPMPEAFHDSDLPPRAVPQREEIARRNRETAARLLEAARPYWLG